ncbi:MAG TPA: ABC transporter ATP-binding protein [Acidimicrobiales bacterium]|nr:ABC transporter ATP-binding protein [Acidimicrobiales bacterium]
MLELRGVHAGYGAVTVLRDVSLSVPEASIVALLGRNGAGKTTTMRVASGMLRPSRGEVWLEGTRVDGWNAADVARRGLAHVPEGRGVFPGLTVTENLEVGAARRPGRRAGIRRDIEYVTATFPRLRERLNQRAGSLSGGEQQMLVLARALMAQPRIVLVDEPSLGLAPVIVEEVYQLLERLKGDGLTILLVEQYVELALEIADYAFVLDKGAVSLEGRADDLAGDRSLLDAYLAVT